MADLAEGEPERVWMRLRAKFGDPTITTRDGRRRSKRDPSATVPFGKGRDPKGIDDVLARFASDMGWTSQLAQGDVLSSWPEIVGAETAARTEPIGIEDGVLHVRCQSTAWATQMRLMRSQITTRLVERFPDAGLASVRFIGPDVPSFKRGIRTVQGRGPRDTWG